MPRGLCDENFKRWQEKSFAEFIAHFVKKTGPAAWRILAADILAEALAFGSTNRSYLEEYGDSHKDEEVRIIAALAWLMLPKSMHPMLTECDAQHLLEHIDTALKSGQLSDAASVVPRELLQREISLALVDLQLCEPSFFPLYRMYEERAGHRLAQENSFHLNGHVLDIVREAVIQSVLFHKDTQALPVAYSDRPGNSVGLRLGVNNRARPQRYQQSLIERQLPFIRED